jgi:hypothetical protein
VRHWPHLGLLYAHGCSLMGDCSGEGRNEVKPGLLSPWEALSSWVLTNKLLWPPVRKRKSAWAIAHVERALCCY